MPTPEPNHQLRNARQRIPSPRTPGACLGRQELAELVNAWVYTHHGKIIALDKNYVGKLENGRIHWPDATYRAALRAILNATTDTDLGFYDPRRMPTKTTPTQRQQFLQNTTGRPHLVGQPPSHAQSWEAGQHQPDTRYRWSLSQAYGVPEHDLFHEPSPASAPEAQLAGHTQPARPTSRVAVPDEERLEHVMNDPASVDLVAVAYLREAIHRIDARYDNAPSLELVGEASQQYSRAAFLSVNVPGGLARRDLLTALAESAILMGQVVWDGSQRRDSDIAVQYFDQAIDAARQVGHPVAEARALLRKSFVALYGTRNPLTGLELATAAGDTGARSSEVISGLALLHVAEAHAMRGERRACEGALADAETHLARAEPTDAAWELFSPAHMSRLAGSCYLFLGDYDRAQHILEESIGSDGAPRTKSTTITAANLSLAYIHQRKVDEAVAALHRAINGITTTRGGGGINLAFAAGRALHRWRQEPAVYEVQDRLWELMTTAGERG